MGRLGWEATTRSAPLGSFDGELVVEGGALSFEGEHAANPREGDPFRGELGDWFEVFGLHSRLTPLTARSASGSDHLLGVQSAQERRLDAELGGDLAAGEERRVVVVDRERARHERSASRR